MSEQVDWHEGLFLHPHHLQAQQRHTADRTVAERELRFAFPYGVVEAKLSPNALANSLVEFERLKVVMPSGLVVDYPTTADLPALPIRAALQKHAGRGSFSVVLGVPRLQLGQANTSAWDGSAEKGGRPQDAYRYLRRQVDVADENTGANPQPVWFRRVNAMLLLEGHGRVDLEEVVEVLRVAVTPGTEGARPQPDPSFVPPCLVLSGSPALQKLVQDIAHDVQAARRTLARQLADGGFTLAAAIEGTRLEQLLRLRTLNRFSSRLAPLGRAPAVTPYEAYLELRELLAELAALHPADDPYDDPKGAMDYVHNSPYPAFAALVGKVRPLLDPRRVDVFKVPLVPAGELLTADLKPEHFVLPAGYQYFLGARTDKPVGEVIALVQSRADFRVLPRQYGMHMLDGVPLEYCQVPPVGVPVTAGVHYFRLNTAVDPMWAEITAERALAVWQNRDHPGAPLLGATLYMTVPPGALQG